MDLLRNEICLVTGATRGIGKAVAHRLARQGATVIGTATTLAGATAISAALSEISAKGKGLCLDVNDGGSVTQCVGHISDEFGAVSVLVNNAGISRNSLLMRMKDSEWEQIIETNLSSIYRLSKACLRGMLKNRHGRIINISSVVGAFGNIGQAHYAAAKAGIMGFSKSLAMETASRNITVNTIAPGFIETDMTSELDAKVSEHLLSQIPAGRMGTPVDVANAAVFLASPLSGYITGTTLFVDGGMSRR